MTGPNYEKIFLDKRLQPQVPDHQQRILDYLRFYQSTDVYSDLYDHYAPRLAEQGIHLAKVKPSEAKLKIDPPVEESLEEAAGEDGNLSETDLKALKKAELVTIAEQLGLSVEGKKEAYVEAILSHQS